MLRSLSLRLCMAMNGSGSVYHKVWRLMKTNYTSTHCLQPVLILQKCNKNQSRLGCLFHTNSRNNSYMKYVTASFQNDAKSKNITKNTCTSTKSFLATQLTDVPLKLSYSINSTVINCEDSTIRSLLKIKNYRQSKRSLGSKVDEVVHEPLKLPENLENDIVIPNYLHFHPACRPDTQREIMSSFQVLYNYLSEDEECVLMKEVDPHLKRRQYEYDHWDDAIHGFRETERSKWGKAASPIVKRMRDFAFPEGENQIAQIHILDLAKTGVIKPHVDSVRFCGNIITGLCLLSDAVMRLVHVENKDQVIDIMLPRRCLYVMRDKSRYKYTHEILGEKDSYFNKTPVPRDRRISVLCRNNPKEDDIS